VIPGLGVFHERVVKNALWALPLVRQVR